MGRDEILILCHSNSEVIVSYIDDLESRYSDLESRYNAEVADLKSRYSDLESQYNELESQNIELRERINELESRSNQNRQNCNKPPSTGFFGNKKRLFVVLCGYPHKNQFGLELKIILPIENDEEPKKLN